MRRPLYFAPRSVTQINYERLPEPDALRDMSLAYRQEVPEEDLDDAIPRCFVFVPIALCLIVFAALPLARLAPVPIGIGVAAFVSLVILGRTTFAGVLSLRLVLFALVVPLTFVGLVYAASTLIIDRLLAAGVLSAIAIGMLLLVGRNPLRFYQEWMSTHPRLKPRSRDEFRQLKLVGPSWFILAGVLAVATVVPRFSSALAFLAILGVCVGWIFRGGFAAVPFDTARDVISRYLSYGASTPYAPGVWQPEETVAQRRWTVRLLTIPLFFALAIGLTMFLPWDLLEDTFARLQYEGFRKQTLIPGRGPIEDMAPWDEGGEWDYSADTPWRWMFGSFAAVVEGQLVYLWSFVVSFVFALTIPPLVLFATYRDGLVKLEELRKRTEGPSDQLLDDDKRPEWQWYVDRLGASKHEAEDPLPPNRTVRERDHLFLGVEPHIQAPVLLDKRLLNQHCYIVGETGSGKTSLGIMPMAIQLLRQDVGSGPGSDELTPVVVIDLKGDMALFSTIKAEAERRRDRLGIDEKDQRGAFRFFTPEPNRSSHFFNPFSSMKSEHRSPSQL